MTSSITVALPAQLGFLKEEGKDTENGLLARLETSDFNEWDGGVAGGPGPIWLFPPNPEGNEAGHLCRKCGEVLCFLVQIYAPLNEVEEAFHRDLCLFICPTCSQVECFRLQMVEENEYYYDDFNLIPNRAEWEARWPNAKKPISDKPIALLVEEEEGVEGALVKEEDSSSEDEDEAEEEEEQTHFCIICRKECELRCTACKQAYYCSVEHQREDWKPRHKKECADLQDAKLTQRDMDKAAADGDMKRFNKLTAGKDREFARFTRVTRAAPEQVLRYQRGTGSNAAALWISKKNKYAEPAPPRCERCGAEREFEFQLLPQFLSFFPHGGDGGGVDFGTIVVYTCTKSCGGSRSQTREFAYLQPEEQV